MRNLVWLGPGLLIACGKSKAPAAAGSAADPGSSGSAGSAVAAAPATASDAAVAPTNPLPDKARCSGHWVAKLDFPDSCNQGKLDAYRDIDVVVAATPTGWQATVAKPAGFAVDSVSVHWNSENGGECGAQVMASNKPRHLDLELDRGGTLELGVVGRIQLAEGECIAFGMDKKYTFTPDNAPLPPVEPSHAALAGTYELAIAWPKIKCSVVPDSKLSFTVAIDRTNSDRLDPKGLPWKLGEIRDNGHHQLYAHIETPLPDVDYHTAEVVLLADVDGTTVTGTASFTTPAGEDDDAKLCEPADGKITGTLQPAR